MNYDDHDDELFDFWKKKEEELFVLFYFYFFGKEKYNRMMWENYEGQQHHFESFGVSEV